jgi:pimeloyl-ACP methyl ester carboxylesterase
MASGLDNNSPQGLAPVDTGVEGLVCSSVGEGPPLLYLHGLRSGPDQVAELLALLARRHQTLFPTMPGFGPSEAVDWMRTVDDASYLYLEWLDGSIGAWLALELATKCPAQFEALILVSPIGVRRCAERGDRRVRAGDHLRRGAFRRRRAARPIGRGGRCHPRGGGACAGDPIGWGRGMKIWYFSETPYAELPPEDDSESIRVTLPSRLYDPEVGAQIYADRIAEWCAADEAGLNIMVNEHHQTATCLVPAVPISPAVSPTPPVASRA